MRHGHRSISRVLSHTIIQMKPKDLYDSSSVGKKFAYKRLAMGVAVAPDIFQSIMMDILGDLPFVLCYLDDILILQKENESEEDHIRKIEIVLQRLTDKGFKANLRKSFFMQKEIEYLGY